MWTNSMRSYNGTPEPDPIALVLPSLYAELQRPALKSIVETLKEVRYLNEIVISLDRASALEFRLANEYFAVLPQGVRLICNDGARIQDLLKLLVSHEIDIGLQGKGRGCWTALAAEVVAILLFASGFDHRVIADQSDWIPALLTGKL